MYRAFFADEVKHRGDGLSVMWSEKRAGTVGGLFVKGYLGTQLRVVQANTGTHSRTKRMEEQDSSSSWTKQQNRETQGIRSVEQRMKRQMHSARRADQERRMTRVEELRELVRIGRYRVDSMAVAQSMLDNETHFMEPPQQ